MRDRMRKLTLLLTTLIFSVMFSPSTSFAGWTEVGENVSGSTYYVDFERIRKDDGYVYYWYLGDYLKPNEYGNFSAKVYIQGDRKKFRYKSLSDSFHKEPMGRGDSETNNTPDKEWRYPSPDSSIETILKSVCQYAR